MKRAPIVIAGTIAGLVAVLEFHTTPASLTLPAQAGTGAGGPAIPGASASPVAPAVTGGGSARKANAGGTAAGAADRSATGPGVNYNFGVISVRVTVSGHKIVKVAIASLNDGSNPRSQFIDQQSIPILEHEVIQAQGANIQGVSGASFTSAGFERSLQSALHSLGFS